MDTLFFIHTQAQREVVFVQALDNEFFEAHKCLERLCSDMYGCRNGVSRYIEDMERASGRDRLAVPSWEQAHQTLKHLRWVRNPIARDSGQVQLCEVCDIRDVAAFYDDILSGRDPLTQLCRYREAHAAAPKAARRPEPGMQIVSDLSDAARPPRRAGCFPAALLLLAGAAAMTVSLLAVLL